MLGNSCAWAEPHQLADLTTSQHPTVGKFQTSRETLRFRQVYRGHVGRS